MALGFCQLQGAVGTLLGQWAAGPRRHLDWVGRGRGALSTASLTTAPQNNLLREDVRGWNRIRDAANVRPLGRLKSSEEAQLLGHSIHVLSGVLL